MAGPGKTGPACTYRPEYCDLAIEAGKNGKSLTWIAAEIGVSRFTVWTWRKEFPDFGAAVELSQAYAQQWWEDAGQNNLATTGFSASMWSRSMAARFPDDWREVKGTELSAPGGGPVQVINRIERVIVDTKD